MESVRTPEITVETIWRTVLVTDARDSSRAYFSDRAGEALVRIERDRALFRSIAASHGGEEVRDRGDGSMFAFCDPVSTVCAAMAMQRAIAAHNAELPQGALRLVHRMGVHMGPAKLAITHNDGEDEVHQKISGDIVVVAARLEQIGHPGEVCFSNDVYKAVRGEIDHEFRFLDATFKGFDRPVRCWSTRLDPTWARPLTPEEAAAKTRSREERRLRQKWEREVRERRRSRIALQVSAVGAALALVFAGFRILGSPLALGRVGHVWSALTTASGSDSPRPATKDEIETSFRHSHGKEVALRLGPSFTRSSRQAREASPALRHVPRRSRPAPRFASRAQIAAALRELLASGRLEDVPTRLEGMHLPADRYDAATEAAQRFARDRDWMAARLETEAGNETGGLSLDPGIAGFSLLTSASDQGLTGLDASGESRTLAYTDLDPGDFARLLRAVATDDDPPPDDPETSAEDLDTLRGGGH